MATFWVCSTTQRTCRRSFYTLLVKQGMYHQAQEHLQSYLQLSPLQEVACSADWESIRRSEYHACQPERKNRLFIYSIKIRLKVKNFNKYFRKCFKKSHYKLFLTVHHLPLSWFKIYSTDTDAVIQSDQKAKC